ncbi:MAG: DUF2125 domain-containing protein [Alphaproteobacteria bacterium]
MASRALKYAFALVIVVIALAAGGWFIAAAAVERALEQWAEERRGEGYEVSWDSLDITGFPIRLNGRLAGARMASGGSVQSGAGGIQQWLWSPPTLTLHFFPLAPNRVDIAAPGRHAFQFVHDDQTNNLFADTQAATARIRLNLRGHVEAISAALSGLEIDNPEHDMRLTAANGTLVVERYETADRPAHQGGFSLSGVELPASLDGPLGTQLTTMAAEVTWFGDLPSGDMEQAMTRWRDTGGRLDIRRASMHWGPVRAVAAGELTLDEALQPQGQFESEIRGMDNAITAFEQAGFLDQRAAALARIAIAALSRAPAGGSAPVVRLPMTIQQRQVSLGPLPLTTLPVIRWR